MAKHRISLVDDNAGNADLASEAESQLRGHSQGTEAPTVLQYLFNLLSAVGRTGACRDVVGWQGATRRRLNACNEEQRRQRATARHDRVRSDVTQMVT